MLLAEILGAEGQLADDLVVDRGRHANPAAWREGFQTYRHIDAVAEQIRPAFDDVAEVHADAQLQSLCVVREAVRRSHRLLDFDGGTHRLDRAGELGQQTIAGHLEDATLVLLYERLDGDETLTQ